MKQNPRRTSREYHRDIREAEYKRQVKLMRPYFGSVFRPSSGYDLRYFEDWTGAQKRKLTKYWRVVAGHVSTDHQARYFRRKDHLETAIAYTQQSDFLPGQRAAIFTVPKEAELDVEFTERGRIRVKREGREVIKAFFDPTELTFEPDKAIKKALARLPESARFKFMTGTHESRETFNRLEVGEHLARRISRYQRMQPDPGAKRHYSQWILGLVAYERKPKRRRVSGMQRSRLRMKG
jgi:hypothetical protein